MLASSCKAPLGVKDAAQVGHPAFRTQPTLAPAAPRPTAALASSRELRCNAWKSNWRTQADAATENRAAAGAAPSTLPQPPAESGSYASPLFSPDFVSTLKDTLRRTSQTTAPEPPRFGGISRNGNGSSSSRASDRHSNGNGAGNGYAAASGFASSSSGGSFSSWRDQVEQNLEEAVKDADRYGDHEQIASISREEDVHIEEDVAGIIEAKPLFNDAFKSALQEALSRSPLFGDDSTGPAPYEQSIAPAPSSDDHNKEVQGSSLFNDAFKNALSQALDRKQSEADTFMGFGSDDDDIAFQVHPVHKEVPRPREPSPQEEVLIAARSSSFNSLQRLTLMKNEIDAAIERETKQLERLNFALQKAQGDAAYMQTLQRLEDQRRRASGGSS